ncbi:hypothetical protein FB446DRAFT_756175 [Lentinula raphanica]|nr:hypothetical protein FB446DRAFT_756175 [Lentinula raphanica]
MPIFGPFFLTRMCPEFALFTGLQILCPNFALFCTVLLKFSLCFLPHSELPEVSGEHQHSLFLLPECLSEFTERVAAGSCKILLDCPQILRICPFRLYFDWVNHFLAL